ncbi:methionine synthase, partial [Candidatus Sumerlaeota bacterium]|nr:methionine synthase [Candidatus Sumerlaeota bacterium]
AQQMVTTADDLRAAGIKLPILVGGAALSEQFTYGRIAPKYDGVVAYASDAMTGLALANRVVDRAQAEDFHRFIEQKKTSARIAEERKAQKRAESAEREPRLALVIDHSSPAPAPPDTSLHVLDDVHIEEIWRFINPVMLYNRHLGLKGKFEELLDRGDPKAVELRTIIKHLEDEILLKNLLRCRSVYRFYRAASVGETLRIQDEQGDEVLRFEFPRQPGGDRRCISDLVAAKESGRCDYIGALVTTCQGRNTSVRRLAEQWKNDGNYLKSHAIQALAIETAEAMAEWLHQKLRAMWGFPDPPGTDAKKLFRAEYRGRRYSFGYPACPRLEDQAKLWALLLPAKHIGVDLTEGFMMEPEASVSALVFHHPQAEYFSVGDVEPETVGSAT